MFFVLKSKLKYSSCLYSNLQKFCEISRFQLWLKICWCVVCCLRHIAAHHALKEQNGQIYDFFALMCVVSHILKILHDFKNRLVCTQHKLKELKNQLKLVALKILIGSTVVFCFFYSIFCYNSIFNGPLCCCKKI